MKLYKGPSFSPSKYNFYSPVPQSPFSSVLCHDCSLSFRLSSNPTSISISDFHPCFDPCALGVFPVPDFHPCLNLCASGAFPALFRSITQELTVPPCPTFLYIQSLILWASDWISVPKQLRNYYHTGHAVGPAAHQGTVLVCLLKSMRLERYQQSSYNP